VARGTGETRQIVGDREGTRMGNEALVGGS